MPLFGSSGRRVRGRQLHVDAALHHRRGDHEDHHEQHHHVDETYDVDLGVERRAFPATAMRHAVLDPPFPNHQRDQLRSEPLELAVEAVHPVREDVVPENRRNGHRERRRRCHERISNTRGYRADVP